MKASRERWNALCGKLGALDNPKAKRIFAGDNRASGRLVNRIYDKLIAAYTGPERHYHNLNHINSGLEKLDEVYNLDLNPNPDALEMAWWWHDFIYNIHSNSNEDQSAASANMALKELNVPAKFRIHVMQLIIATKHDYIPDSFDRRLIIDIDLTSLGNSPEIFDQNTANIRKEYAHVSNQDFVKKRAQFFRKFLEGRPSIYLTNIFRNRYEAQAQENLKRTIEKSSS